MHPILRLLRPLPGLACLALLLPAAAPMAGAGTIYGLTADTDVRADGFLVANTSSGLLPGGSGSPAQDRSSVFVFQLPNLGAVADPFESADFRFNLSSIESGPPNVDLYGIPRRSSPSVLASDYYGETSVADPTNATLLQTDILTSSLGTGLKSTGISGRTALRDFLNAQYAGGAGAGQHVFLRLSTNSPPGGVKRYTVTSADGGVASPIDTRPRIVYNEPPVLVPRPFIWVRDSEKADILAKIAGNAWATSLRNTLQTRMNSAVASHQADRDAYIRELPVDWNLTPAVYRTTRTYTESQVRGPSESKFNAALDCAVLYYLTGDTQYARLAGDILHNTVRTLIRAQASTSVGNGGWIFYTDFLKEARVTGTQLPMVYDFLYQYLNDNQVYDVQTAGMADFAFDDAQAVFRKLYQLCRDHGQTGSNWSALMSTCMLNNLLALDDESEREAALQIYLTTGGPRQRSLSQDYQNYTQTGDIWPESLQYANAVASIRATHMVLIERYDPARNLFTSYPNLPLSLGRVSELVYPNNQLIRFGDGQRTGGTPPYFRYEVVYQHALARGRADLTSYFGPLINEGIASGAHNRASLPSYSSLGQHDELLKLLWFAPEIPGPAATPVLPRTDRLPFAGITLQRNPSPNGANHGLMGFVGGAGFVHSHASGMSMELYGLGHVLGAKGGRSDYGSTLHEKYYRLFAANNTVIVNGASRGQGGWADIAINTVQNVAMEPAANSQPVSPDHSFSVSSFVDDKGSLAQGTQQRTLALVRTSPTSGFYVDFFRTKSTVTNRTATTLNGNVTDQYHDYIYRNVGNLNPEVLLDGSSATFVSQANRFLNDIGDAYDQPGWRYFTNTMVTYPVNQTMRARFTATISGQDRCMTMHMPAVATREIAKVESPAIADAPSPYTSAKSPTLVIRQIGDAWDRPFAAVYEPHFGVGGGTVQNVTRLLRDDVVVGVKIESVVDGNQLVHYVMANPNDGETYTDSSVGLSFKGRFGIAADLGDGNVTLYLGQGSSIAYGGYSMTTVNGSSSQAEARFVSGEAPVVTSNTPVNAVAPVSNTTWIPTAASSGLDWTDAANWISTFWPDEIGAIAMMDIDIAGDQAVNLNAPITLGELVVGDSNGNQTTTLQRGTGGSLTFDQPDTAMAYLTRTDGGTGTVTLAGDLDITLEDDLTVRPAAGSADSTMIIAGNLSGAGKSLAKVGENLALILAGDNTHSGVTRIAGGLLRADSATALGSGNLTLQGGVLGLAAGDFTRQLGTGDGQLDWSSGSGGFAAFGADREVRLNNGTGTFSWSTAIIGGGNTLILGHPSATHTLDFKNGISFAGSKRTIRVEDGEAAVDAILNGVLSGGNSSGFNKTGGGALSLAKANTYSGVTTVNEGVLRLQHADALPGGNLELAGGILGLGAGDMLARGIGTGADQVQWTGEGGFAAYGADRAVIFSDSFINWNATNFIGMNRTLVLGHETADATLDWRQKISLAGNSRSIRVDDGSAAIDARMSGTVAGGSSGTSNVFIKTGAGTLAFTSQNSYWGDTIVGAGTLMIGDGGDTGGVSQNSPNIIVETGATLAVNRHDMLTQGTNPLKTAIAGDGNFAQTGPGSTVLTLANTYTGITTIAAGTLALGADNVLPDTSPVAIGSATLDAAIFSDTAGTLAITGNAIIRLDAGGALVFADSDTIDWGGGALMLEGAFVSGMSLRFGDGSGDGLSAGQLTRITAAGFANFGIDGSGFLTADAVSSSGFDTWKTTNSATGGLDDDHDGDGVANGIEYFIGGPNGDTTGFTALPGVTDDAGTFSVIFTKAADYAGIYATDYEVQVSTTLDSWDPAPGGSVTFPSATEVKYTFPTGTKNFARLVVTEP